MEGDEAYSSTNNRQSDSGKDWHNWRVGEGYQARGVVRQRTGETEQKPLKIIDMSKPVPQVDSHEPTAESSAKSKVEKQKKPKKSLKSSSSSSKKYKNEKSSLKSKTIKSLPFNPLLQLFATRISDTTMTFK